MSNPRFDLVDIMQSLRSHKRTIITVSLVTAILGGLVFLVSKRKYRASGSFMMTNPLYTDRNNLFQVNNIQFVDYFAGDDDVDKIMALIESDTIKYSVAQKLGLYERYKLDANKPKEARKMLDIFKDNFKAVRSEYNGCDISYDDPDPVLAADVVNESMKTIEEVFRSYYVGQRRKLTSSLQAKIGELDSTINVMTDTLAKLRDQYKIYDLINPTRKNLVSSTVHGSGANLGWAIEQIQNVESLKDQAVADRARYTSVINEYTATSKADDDKLMHVMTKARIPGKPKQPGLTLTVLSCGLIGLLFSSLFLLMRQYYRSLIAVQR